MIDSHCHLDCAAFDADRGAVLDRAAGRGLSDIVVPAVDERSREPVLALAQAHSTPRCHAALGLHPACLPDVPASTDDRLLAALETLAAQERIVAIGECGLDRTVSADAAPPARQEHLLRTQVALARRLSLPLVLHARGPGCHEWLLRVLESETLPACGSVLHSYGGGIGLLPRFLALPLSFGFAGPVTWPAARRVREAVRSVPPARLLAETDAPDQTPEPYRPGRNEPSYLPEIIGGLAVVRAEDAAALGRTTAQNARRLFRLEPHVP